MTPNVFGDDWDALDDWSGEGAKSTRLRGLTRLLRSYAWRSSSA